MTLHLDQTLRLQASHVSGDQFANSADVRGQFLVTDVK
jgi:hypothetical protein